MVIWIILDMIHKKVRDQNTNFVSIPGVCSATVVGLVVITPGAGYVQPGYALLMGLIGGSTVYIFLTGKKHFFHIDDTLDVFSCHGIGGFIGTALTGLFCQVNVNSDGRNGAIYGRPIQLGHQLLGIIITICYSGICTAIILLLMHFTIGIRINREEQVRGLDNVAHGVLDLEQTHRVPQIKLSATKPRSIEGNIIEGNMPVISIHE